MKKIHKIFKKKQVIYDWPSRIYFNLKNLLLQKIILAKTALIQLQSI